MNEKPYQPFYKPYGMSDEEYAYECNLAQERLQQWETEQSEQQMIEEEMQKEVKQEQPTQSMQEFEKELIGSLENLICSIEISINQQFDSSLIIDFVKQHFTPKSEYDKLLQANIECHSDITEIAKENAELKEKLIQKEENWLDKQEQLIKDALQQARKDAFNEVKVIWMKAKELYPITLYPLTIEEADERYTYPDRIKYLLQQLEKE